MRIQSVKSFSATPQGHSSNRHADTRPVIAVLPPLPSNIDLSPIDSPGSRQLSDGRTIAPTETRVQAIGTALPIEQLERVARHPAGRDEDAPHLMVEADRLQDLLELPSPVTRLPPEILAYIFELYVVPLGELTADDRVPTHASERPFRLAQVCKLWRAVAESDPHPWTSIHFYFPESRSSRKKDVLRVKSVLDLHLKRSRSLPISLTWVDHRTYHSVTEDLVALLIDRLRTHGRRWKRISLQLSCGYFPLLFMFTVCADLSFLEHLYISGDVMLSSLLANGLFLNLKSATNLKSFTYSGPGNLVQDILHLHWEGLVGVSFEFAPHCGRSFTLSRQFKNLALCENITTCSIGIDQTRREPRSSPTTTLPRLQTLRVRRLSPDAHASCAIDRLILPQLQTLEIDASILVIWNTQWHNRTFSDLLARSACTLLHLSIRDVDFPNDELIRCLALSPALTSLRFIPCPRSQNISDVVRRLDVSRTADRSQIQTQGQGPIANSGPFLPQLREITLASSVEGYLDLMAAMFRSRAGARARAAGVAALRRAEVVFFDLWHDTDADRVRAPGARLERGRVASFQADLARWVSENRNESGKEDGESKLEASVAVDSPYLPEYIDVQ
ncbi:hypothetical protein HD554DRAFT_2174946 [Boletus coccyginus]|nr:hypothetical protein HD554DRAFT_2174946 [Boletus coccyginus]